MGKMLFLGVEGAGKSTLTAALATYFIKHGEHGWSLRPENKEAFTFSERMTKKFAAGELPAQTARFRRLEWSLCYQGNVERTLEVLDYPGEIYRLAFLDPSDDPHPEQLAARQQAHSAEIKELMRFLADADQIFLLFNLNDARELETNDDNIDAVWVTVSALKVLFRLKNKPEVSLMLTQADRLAQEGLNVADANALVREYAPIIAQHFKELDIRALSAVDCENEAYGLRPLIRGMLRKTPLYGKSGQKREDTFAWICPEIERKRLERVEAEELRDKARNIASSKLKCAEKIKQLQALKASVKFQRNLSVVEAFEQDLENRGATSSV